jgi:hypothetical protein
VRQEGLKEKNRLIGFGLSKSYLENILRETGIITEPRLGSYWKATSVTDEANGMSFEMGSTTPRSKAEFLACSPFQSYQAGTCLHSSVHWRWVE